MRDVDFTPRRSAPSAVPPPVGPGPLFSYFGAKWRLAKHYPVPRMRVVEPFAGSACYSLYWRVHDAVLCETDPKLAALWRWLIRAPETEIRALPDLPLDVDLRSLGVRPEAETLIGYWLGRGDRRPRRRFSSWAKDLSDGRLLWGARARERVALMLPVIRNWFILDDYREAAPSFDSGSTTWFIDPPYANVSDGYRRGCDRLDFAKLGEWCRARIGQTIVCERAGADWLPFASLRTASAMRGAKRVGQSVEVVYLQERTS